MALIFKPTLYNQFVILGLGLFCPLASVFCKVSTNIRYQKSTGKIKVKEGTYSSLFVSWSCFLFLAALSPQQQHFTLTVIFHFSNSSWFKFALSKDFQDQPYDTSSEMSSSLSEQWLLDILSFRTWVSGSADSLLHLQCFIFFYLFYFIFKLYIIALVLPNIKMNLPQAVLITSIFPLSQL